MKTKLIVVVFSLLLVACAPIWRTYSPPVSDLVGNSAQMFGKEIVVAEKLRMLGGKPLEMDTRSSTELEKVVTAQEINAALDFLYEKVSIKFGLSSVDKKTITTSNVEVDSIKNWAWMPAGQTFVYAAMRADKATIDLTTSKSLKDAEIKDEDIGTLSISAKGENQYNITITNPKVYYRVQLAKINQTFPGEKYSNGWITPITLSEQKNKETSKIRPFQYFWKRWFGNYEMPSLSLVMEEGSLFVRATRGLDSSLISLAQHEKDGRWDAESLYLTDFPTGELERKFVVLDIKASRKDSSSVVISHARIRYPEVRLQISR